MLKYTSYILLLLSILAIIATLFGKCFKLIFDPTLEGFIFFIKQFQPFNTLFYETILTITVAIALETYIHSKQIDEVSGLQKLRELLTSDENMKIHEMLEWDTEEEKISKSSMFKEYYNGNKCHVYNYLGILELSEIYLRNNIITDTLFMEQFGYRIENVFSNDFLKNEIDKNRKYWNTLYDLYSRIITIQNNHEN